jgi:DNA-directed RNA polymerase specialized sigma24 family protein
VVRSVTVGDPRAAIEHVYREQRATLWRSLVAYTGDPEAAEDALAESFAQALARGEGVDRWDAWIWRTAFRVAAGAFSRPERPGSIGDAGSYDLPSPIDHLVHALAQLSPKQRLAVVLHDYADRPTDEIAEVLGSSRATVHVHLSQGRRRLRGLLKEDGDA